ncbi:MAG: hypothetical protein J6V01_09005, partial [Clostridia bacterium]|nr:hypothetical protein [Clostridia bacterium]
KSCRLFPRLFLRRNLEKPPVFLRFLSKNRHKNNSAISARELCGIALNIIHLNAFLVNNKKDAYDLGACDH